MKPVLSKKHKEARLQCAKDRMTWTSKWDNTVFSDENRFTLDGRDSYRYYFHDLRKENLTFCHRQNGGGGVKRGGVKAVLRGCDLGVHCSQNEVRNRVCSYYIELRRLPKNLTRTFTPTETRIRKEKWQFQQDNAPCHASRSSMKWFLDNNIDVLPWPSRSPDVNPIENIWGYLSRQVYANSRQYSTVSELKQGIIDGIRCQSLLLICMWGR